MELCLGTFLGPSGGERSVKTIMVHCCSSAKVYKNLGSYLWKTFCVFVKFTQIFSNRKRFLK